VLTAPFVARWVVAWTVSRRVRGWYVGNASPRVESTDFPAPNNAGREFLRYIAANVFAWPFALGGERILGPIAPHLVWPLADWAVLAITLVWIFRRLRADDRLWIRLKRQRIADAPSD
jgi:hypothetical protein